MTQIPRFSHISLAVVCLVLSACQTTPTRFGVPAPLQFKKAGDTREGSSIGPTVAEPNAQTAITAGPTVPPLIGGNLRPIQPPTATAEAGKGDISVGFEQMALPAFIQAIYGGILKLNYSLDPAVMARTELVTFRTPQPLTAAKLTEVTGQLLRSYGLAAQDLGGVIRIVPQANITSTLPLIRRGRAQPSVPLPLRPIFHYIETESVRPQNFVPTLRNMLGNKVTLEADVTGGLLISGQPEDVQVALELVQVFDQPSLRGLTNARVVPRYWTADELGRRLSEVLRAEGYSVGSQPGSGDPITLIALPPINSLLIFSNGKEVLDHTLAWVRELDQIGTVRAGNAFFTYPVRHADAQELAKALNDLISGSASAAPPTPGAAAGAAGAASPLAAASRQKRVVVNNATNTLIFQGGNQEEYRQWLALLTDLDKPAKSVLLDVLVAEVALGDNNDLGFSWQLDQLGSGATSVRLDGSTFRVNASGAGVGMNVLLGGNPFRQLAINALASKSDARVISNPTLMTRNGESASISVGQEVPTITSQAINSNGITGNIVPQTVQYRNTGVLLRVRPVIHAGDRIDIDVSQEVSSAEPTTTGVTTSPTIRKRSVDTKLTLRDGATVLLGGLISETSSTSDSGVPLLKDIPGVGSLFERNTRTRSRTELVILITPYIINDSLEAEAATDAFQGSLGEWAQGVRERMATQRQELESRRTLNPPVAAPTPAPPQPAPAAPAAPAPQSLKDLAPPAQPPASTPAEGRMINLATPVLTLPPQAAPLPTGAAQAAPPASQGAPTTTTTPAPAPQALPALPPGSPPLPPGSRVVQDPELLREILRATGRQ